MDLYIHKFPEYGEFYVFDNDDEFDHLPAEQRTIISGPFSTAEDATKALNEIEDRYEQNRAEAVGGATEDIIRGIAALYELFDGDGMAVGEVMYECDKAGANRYYESLEARA